MKARLSPYKLKRLCEESYYGEKKNTAERGKFKQEIHAALYKNEDIKELLLGDISSKKVMIYEKNLETTLNLIYL